MDKQKFKADALATITRVVNNVMDERGDDRVEVKESDVLSDFGFDSLEAIILMEELEQDCCGTTKLYPSDMPAMTVKKMCEVVAEGRTCNTVNRYLHDFLKKEEKNKYYFKAENLTFSQCFDDKETAHFIDDVKQNIGVDLTGINLKNYYFNDLLQCIVAKI